MPDPIPATPVQTDWILDLEAFGDPAEASGDMILRPTHEPAGFQDRDVSTTLSERTASIHIARVPPCKRCRLEMMLCANSEMTATVLFNGRHVAALRVLMASCFSVFLPLTPAEADSPFQITINFSNPVNPLRAKAALGLPPVRRIRLHGTTPAASAFARMASDPPSDDRAAHPLQITERDVMARFISLGDNCELGIAQRHYGAEPLDLYRFSGVSLGWIIEAMDRGFAGIDDAAPDQFYLAAHPKPDGNRYYFAYQEAYRIPYETGIPESQAALEKVRTVTLARLKRLGEKLIDDLSHGARIVVIKRAVPYSFAEIDVIRRRLRRYGRCWLLLVELANSQHPHTAVEHVAPGVLRGYLRQFSDGTRVVDTTDHAGWLLMCRRAYTIWWQENHGRPSPARLPVDFDPLSYLEWNPDVASSGMDPAVHYLAYGVYENRPYRDPARQLRAAPAEPAASRAAY